MKPVTFAVIASLAAGALVLPSTALSAETQQIQQQNATYTDAELDSLLAPVALYPDTILTHILIASTYPLEVVAADRWRQDHAEMDSEEVEEAIEDFNWDPSVKAIVPFSDILHTLSNDLDWLQALGDNVLISQSRVLARVQVLRQHALNAGTLTNNEYQRIERDREVIVIEPVRKEIVYVPYYDTRVVYGNWWHPAIAPVYWHHPVHYHQTASFYWNPGIRLSTTFYFGGISWHDRHVIVTRRPVKRFYYGSDIKRSYSRDYQPWQHSAAHRRVRYSDRVVSTKNTRYINDARPVRHKVDYNSSSRNAPAVVSRSVVNRQEPVSQKHVKQYTGNETVKRSTPDKQYRQIEPRAKRPETNNIVRQSPDVKRYTQPVQQERQVKQYRAQNSYNAQGNGRDAAASRNQYAGKNNVSRQQPAPRPQYHQQSREKVSNGARMRDKD